MAIDAIVRSRAHDVRAALTTLPTATAWRRCASLQLLFLAVAAPIGFGSGLLHASLAPLTTGGALAVAVTIAIHPALTEEILFRALLLPRLGHRVTRQHLFASVAMALSLYVVAHPLNAWFFWPAAFGLFSNPIYLVLTALLGLACTAAYLISGSIWPSVAMHWLTVVLWILLLGGQALLQRAV